MDFYYHDFHCEPVFRQGPSYIDIYCIDIFSLGATLAKDCTFEW